MKQLLVIFLVAAYLSNVDLSTVNGWWSGNLLHTTVGKSAIIPFPEYETYTRNVGVGNKTTEQLYRVCNGKNKKKCGFWENIKTKKKVTTGVTIYNKKKQQLVIKNVKIGDSGLYYYPGIGMAFTLVVKKKQ